MQFACRVSVRCAACVVCSVRHVWCAVCSMHGCALGVCAVGVCAVGVCAVGGCAVGGCAVHGWAPACRHDVWMWQACDSQWLQCVLAVRMVSSV